MVTARSTATQEELRLMTRVAYLYHTRGLKQSQIAQQLDLSQATVSRVLRRAESERIVKTSVNIPTDIHTDLEDALCRKYGLKSAIVVHCDDDSDDAIVHHIGSAAAFYVERTLHPNEVVGLSSWSASLLAMVNAMHPTPKGSNAKVVQILGGVGQPSAEMYATRITERFATLVQGEPVYLPAPGVASSEEVRNQLIADVYVREALDLFDRVSLAIVGIGSIEPSKLLVSSGNVFTSEELNALEAAGAVGDICLRFFDADGRPVALPLDKRVVSMRLEQLAKAQRVLGLAGGKRKSTAICAALRGKLVNVLITDHKTAATLAD